MALIKLLLRRCTEHNEMWIYSAKMSGKLLARLHSVWHYGAPAARGIPVSSPDLAPPYSLTSAGGR